MQGFEEETLGRLGIARWTQEKLQRVPLGIDRPVEIRPRSFDLDVGFVNASGVIGGFEMRLRALLQFGGIVLHPAIDGCLFHRESPFPHHLFEVAVAQRVAQVPPHAQHNDLGFEMAPL
jgi:hypothetical protein